MSLLSFFFGKNLKDNTNVAQKAGAFYLDTAKKELWYDDPDSSITSDYRHKIVDTATLVYEVEETISFPGETESGGTTAKLGAAVLGSMVLGAE